MRQTRQRPTLGDTILTALEPPANPATGALIGASCPSRVFCMVVDSTGHELTWHGTRWSAAVVYDPHGTTGPISCPTASFCAATDTEGQVLMWDNNKWSRPFELAPVPHQPAPVISCASPTFCAAIAEGDAFVWNGTSGSSGQYLNTPYYLKDVSCPDPSFCVAIDEVGTAVTWDGCYRRDYLRTTVGMPARIFGDDFSLGD